MVNSPRGVTGLHLRTSLHTASTIGSLGRSSKVGSRSLPVTASSSFCTIVWTSGRIKTATKNVIMEAKVYKRGTLSCRHTRNTTLGHVLCQSRLKNVLSTWSQALISHLPAYIDPKAPAIVSSVVLRSDDASFSVSCRFSRASDGRAEPLS